VDSRPGCTNRRIRPFRTLIHRDRAPVRYAPAGHTEARRRVPAVGDSLATVTHFLARLGLLVCLFVVACCGVISTSPPAPTPADFQGLAGEMVSRGIVIDHLVSGDAGCDDHTLVQTAIGFDASGLDQAEPVRMHLYIFRDREAYERLRSTIDACAQAFVTDPVTFESIDDSPFVLAAQGPWGPEFKAALRDAIEVGAGTGD